MSYLAKYIFYVINIGQNCLYNLFHYRQYLFIRIYPKTWIPTMKRKYRLKIKQIQPHKEAKKHLEKILTIEQCVNIIEPSMPRSTNGFLGKWTDGIVEVKEGDCIQAFRDRIYSGDTTFRIQPVKVK